MKDFERENKLKLGGDAGGRKPYQGAERGVRCGTAHLSAKKKNAVPGGPERGRGIFVIGGRLIGDVGKLALP